MRSLRLLLLIALLSVDSAAAQASQVGDHPIRFEPGSSDRDGYAQASVTLRYQFRVCTDEIQVLYAADLADIEVSNTYWYRGRPVEIDPREIPPPRPGSVPVAARVRKGDIAVAEFSDQHTMAQQLQGCLGQARRVGLIRELIGERPSRDAVQFYLDVLFLEVEGLPTTLRNPAIESRLAGEARRQTADSLSAASRDSVARAARGAARDSARADTAGTSGSGRSRRPARQEESEDEARTRVSLAAAALRALDEAAQAERSGDKARAARLYSDIAGGRTVGLFTPEQIQFAQRRSMSLAGQAMGDAGVQGLAAAAGAEGIGAGLLYGAGYFNGSFFAGATIGTARGTRLQYFDIAVGSGLVADWMNATDTLDVAADTNERAQFMFRLGSTLPGVRLHVGGGKFLAPHFSYTMYITDDRRLDLLTTGLALWSDGSTYLRLDAMIVSGSPQFGFAVGL